MKKELSVFNTLSLILCTFVFNKEYMRTEFSTDDFNVALATSVVVFGFDGQDLNILISKKRGEPFNGAWIIPSSVVRVNEATNDVAKELLVRVTGKGDWPLEKLNGFGEPYRNPVGRVVNIAWYCTVRLDEELGSRLKSTDYRWVKISDVPPLAYDHNAIFEYALERLKRRVKRRPIGFSMLPREFTMGQIQRLYESALGKSLDKRNFQRKLLKSQLLIDLDKNLKSSPQARRPAKLYKFDEKKYRTLTLRGYDFIYQ